MKTDTVELDTETQLLFNPHRDFVMRDLTSRRDLPAFIAIIRDWGAIVSLVLLAEFFDVFVLRIVIIVAIGVFQFAIGEVLLHEASHRNLFSRAKWNDNFELLYALPFLTTIRVWREEHQRHHQHLGEPQDHIVADYQAFGLTSQHGPRVFWACFWRPLLGISALDRLRWIAEVNSPKDWSRIVIFWTMVVAASMQTGVLVSFLTYWTLPLLFVFPVLLEWSEIGDHYCTRTGTRSRTSRIYNWLWHNNGFHSLHHRFPRIPFYHIQRAYACFPTSGEEEVDNWLALWKEISQPVSTPPSKWVRFWPRMTESENKSSDRSTGTGQP